MTNKPEKKFRAGLVTATIWKNEGKNKQGDPTTFRTVAIERSYTDKNNEWKTTSSFSVQDLPKVTLVASRAYEYIVMRKAPDAAAGNQPGEVEEEQQPPVIEEEVI